MTTQRGLFRESVVDDNFDRMNQEAEHLTVDELDELKDIVKTIHSGTPVEKQGLSNKLKDCDQLVLYKFSQRSQDFKNFCENKEYDHIGVWAEELEDIGLIAEDLYPVAGEKISSVFEQYLAAFFYSKYMELLETEAGGVSASFWLAKACEFNSFHALLTRSINNREKIKRPDTSEKEETIAVGQILQDLKALGNYFWSVGYLHASLILLDVGNYYGALDEESSGGKEMGYHMEAVKNFYYGSILAGNHMPEDNKRLEALYPGEGLAIFGFRDWQVAEDHILEQIDQTLVPYQTIRKEAQEKINQWIETRITPMVD